MSSSQSTFLRKRTPPFRQRAPRPAGRRRGNAMSRRCCEPREHNICFSARFSANSPKKQQFFFSPSPVPKCSSVFFVFFLLLSDKQTHSVVTHRGLTCADMARVSVSISRPETHFSSEHRPVIEPCDKSLEMQRFALTDTAQYSVILLLRHFVFIVSAVPGEKALSLFTWSCTITVLHANDRLLLCWL